MKAVSELTRVHHTGAAVRFHNCELLVAVIGCEVVGFGSVHSYWFYSSQECELHALGLLPGGRARGGRRTRAKQQWHCQRVSRHWRHWLVHSVFHPRMVVTRTNIVFKNYTKVLMNLRFSSSSRTSIVSTIKPIRPSKLESSEAPFHLAILCKSANPTQSFCRQRA